MSRWSLSSRRLVVLAIAVTVLCASVAAGIGAAHDENEPAIVVSDVEVDDGERATATVTLTMAPTGLSGFDVNVSAQNATVRITNVSISEPFSVSSSTTLNDSAVRIRGVDLNEEVDVDAEDVEFATIELERVDAGPDSLEVTITRLDDDDGRAIEAGTHAGTVTAPEGFALGFGGPASTLWFVATAVVALLAAVGIRFRGRR